MKRLLLLLLTIGAATGLLGMKPHVNHRFAAFIHGMDNPQLTGIYNQGIANGNLPGIFAKVGDSISMDNGYFLVPIGLGYTVYGNYDYYQSTIEYYQATSIGNDNSFSHLSVATRGGLRTPDLLSPAYIGVDGCAVPLLECEYDSIHPSVSIILIGTNDAGLGGSFHVSLEDFEANMRQIIQISLDRNIIPILSTLPRWLGINDGNPRDTLSYSEVIIVLAEEYGIPWIDFRSALEPLPHYGLSSPDGVHPSAPTPYTATANFSEVSLSVYGYNIRNILTVEALDQFREKIAHHH